MGAPGELPAGNHATHLVSQHERILHPICADTPFCEPVQVGTTEPHGGNAHQRLVGAGNGVGLGVQSDVTGTVEPQRIHVGTIVPARREPAVPAVQPVSATAMSQTTMDDGTSGTEATSKVWFFRS